MFRFCFLASALTFGLASAAVAQTPETAPATAPAGNPAAATTATTDALLAATERVINQQAKPLSVNGLMLYPKPAETGKPIHISGWRQIQIRSIIDSTWARTVYGGAQFYVKRADIQFVAAGAPAGAAPGTAK